ncbi:MAG: putative cobalt-zinc-cadmium resistance protein czcC [Chthonomonadaceae bacterium]|nr:putative cobalt-zinc-cadmium resistance protein czcC [Chthonomonadaceae bacterium]
MQTPCVLSFSLLCLGTAGFAGQNPATGQNQPPAQNQNAEQNPNTGQADTPAVPGLPPDVPSAQRVTLAEALRIAAQNNPQLTASVHQVASAQANLSGQKQPVNPNLFITGITNTPSGLDPSDPTRYGVIYTLETSGRQRWRMGQARAQLQGTQADAVTTRLTVQQTTASAYADLQTANSNLQTEREAYDTAKRLYDLTTKRVDLGDAPASNATRTRIAVTQEEQNLDKAVTAVRQARAVLNIQLGRDPELPIDAADPLAFTALTLKLEDLQKLALQSRPELRSAEANRRALDNIVKLQRSQSYPDLQFGANPRTIGDSQVEIAVALPLFDFGSIRGAVNKAKEDVKVQDAQIVQVQQQIRLDVQNAYIALTQSQRLIASFQDGILPRTQTLLNQVQQGYALGASSILDVIDAQQTYRSARNDYNNALGDHRRALAQLQRALGAPIPTR